MQIALDQIDFMPTGLRASEAIDPSFVDSVRTLGVLQPVLLRPVGNRYEVVKGERRVRAAREAGYTEIPAHIDAALIGAHAVVARLAATIARRPLTTTEQWRALCTLTDQGYDLAAAAVNVGIEPRTARQMERLGRLHPDLLAAYEECEQHPSDYLLPEWSDLGIIAAAPPDDQMAAARACGFPDFVEWEELADKLRHARQRIPRAWAIFDTTLLPWTEDLFAEPDSALQFTATDAAAFLDLQRAALADLANASKGRIQVGDGWGRYKAPKGWIADAWLNEKPSPLAKTDKRTVFGWVETSGNAIGRVSWAIARPAAAAAPTPAQQAAIDEANTELDAHMADAGADEEESEFHGDPPDDDETERNNPSPATPEPDQKLPLTKAGQALLAKARTEALRAALRDPDRRYSYDDLLAMLVIALAAGTVRVKASHHNYASTVDMRDLAARLLDSHGNLRTDGSADPGRVATEALARMLCLPEPDEIGGYNQAGADSARIPLAIGAIAGADQHMPRLDTEPFLAQVAGLELKAWAKAEGVKLSKVTEIRTRMAGRAESWRPAWALFDPQAQQDGQGREAA